jgi:hypothetical protein
MKILRDRQRGAAAAVVGIILVIILAAAVYWFASNKAPSRGSGSALELAKLIPSESHSVWAWDLNGQVDLEGWVKDFKELQSQMPESPQNDYKEFEKELGMPLEAWIGLYDGRGFVAAVPGESAEKLGAVCAIGLADGAKFDTWWKEQSSSYEGSPTSKDIDGVAFLSFDDGPFLVGHDNNWLYMANSEANAKKLLASTKGGQNLDSLPEFKEGIKELGTTSSGSFVFFQTRKISEQFKSAGLPGTDDQTFAELAAFEYVVGSADFHAAQWDGYVKISGESQLAKQLTTPGGLSDNAMSAISNKVTNANSLDVQWTINTLLKLAALPPESRAQAALGGMALMSQGDPWAAFNGDLTVAGNATETLVGTLSENFGAARGQGQLTACKSNLKNIGTALEMYSTDYSGKYPKEMSLLTPNYLINIPDCPAAGQDTYSDTLQTGPDAPGNEPGFEDYYAFYCQGHHHPQTQENFPKYNGIVGLEEGEVQAPTPEAADSAPEEPSTVVIATLKDPATTHGYISKMMPLGGEPPKEGEEQEYDLGVPMPGMSFKLSNKGVPLAIFSYGPDTASILDTSSGKLADLSTVKELRSWAKEGIVYLDYLNLEPAYDDIHKLLAKSEDPEAKFGLAVMEKIRARVPRMDGGSCLAAKPNGLHYRALGVSNTSFAAVGAAILVPNFIRARAQGQTTACKSNLKNMGTALEMYSTDYSGEYPKDVSLLTPNYLKTIPDCPAAGRDTYSESYSLKQPEGNDWLTYYLYCSGENHTEVGLPENSPSYNGIEGLVDSSW